MRTTFLKKPLLVLSSILFALTLSSCGGGSSIVNDFIDDAVENQPGWELNGLRFVASKASKNSLFGYDSLTTTSVGLNSANEVITSIVTLQYDDRGPGLYTLVSSFDQLISRQSDDPQGKFLLIAASIINLSNNSTEYQSDDLGFANVTLNTANDLVFNIPSPVSLIRNSGDAFPEFPINIFFTLIDIFEDLPTPSFP